ncbi:putative receptor-like protein kinase [Acorus calamus]|uniref:non-specific serine/threonine protein kinase n=1 Tax=Acorus calamus TaxID=4465 RepID=A0AAV9F227_ACOCL|nr:putative receptor-like protein kinase [Acorus calamus]
MSGTLAAVIGGAAGAVALVGIVIVFIYFCLLRTRSASRNSDTNSSDPSLQVGRNVGLELSLRPSDSQEARCFTLEELGLATKSFSDINLIGEGKFGEVYNGLLQDGLIVAIKKRTSLPSQEFINEVLYLSSIRHRNLVSLLGYCQENDQQMLIYEHVPNGSVSSHLYGARQASNEKLEFKHRLSIALGAAKGLSHLHNQNPPLVHKDFKTANVLVDENFIAKVADAGIKNLLSRTTGGAGPSSGVLADDVFQDPWVHESGRYSEKSDVYSFGVFLLELVSGHEASAQPGTSKSDHNILNWARRYQEDNDVFVIVDRRMGSSFTSEGMKEFLRLGTLCVSPSPERRPTMNQVVSELDRVLEKEMSLTTIMGEGTLTVTPGSHLFTGTR